MLHNILSKCNYKTDFKHTLPPIKSSFTRKPVSVNKNTNVCSGKEKKRELSENLKKCDNDDIKKYYCTLMASLKYFI